MLDLLINLALMLGAFAFMEGVAAVTHRHVMHGFLWCLHKSHHRPREGIFELNDLFAVFFASPAIVLIYLGTNSDNGWLLWIGIGITLYGAAYFIFHDMIVHRRARFPYKPRSGYMKRIIQAHWIHHAVTEKEGAVSFGFLYSPPIEKVQAELRNIDGPVPPV